MALGKSGGETACQCRDAPEQDTDSDDGLAAEAVGEEAKRDAADGENHEEKGLQ